MGLAIETKHATRQNYEVEEALVASLEKFGLLKEGAPVEWAGRPAVRMMSFSQLAVRRMADLGRIQAHADDPGAERQRFFQGGNGFFFRQVAQEAHDQRGADRSVLAGARDAVDDGLERHAARGMRLRVEEDLRVADIVGVRAGQVRHRHVVEVLLGQQDTCAGVINVQERLQIGESVRLTQRFDRCVGKCHPIPLRQLKNQLGLERAFNVDVQFCLRHRLQQVAQLFVQHGFSAMDRWNGFRQPV